jgi:YD repeat-containing protein
MVAVISGNRLGLDNSSLRQLGQGGQATIGQGDTASYLNVETGNLTLQNADEGLVFDGLPLDVLRTYNSQGQLTGNHGWLFGFTRSVGGLTGTLDTAGSAITRTGDDGSTVTYVYNATQGPYVSTGQSGADDTLSWSATSSTWTWTDAADQRQETYNANGQLIMFSDSQTGASYNFAYSGGQLSTITAASDGDTLIFGYNASNQLISLSTMEVPPGSGTAVTRQQVGYAYDTQGRLQMVTATLDSDTDASTSNCTTLYNYDSIGQVIWVGRSDGTSASYTYAADTNGLYRVASITTGTGAAAQTLTLSYNLDTDTTTVTNALGQATTYKYAGGGLPQVGEPTVNGVSPTTSYTCDANGNPLTMTDADGGITAYSYDANGNLLGVEDPTGHTISYTYNTADQVLSKTVYTVPAEGVAGQSGYVAPGGAQTTYNVYDASNRLAYVVDPLGNVTQHTYTSVTGGLVVLSSTQQYLGATYSLTGLSPGTPPILAQLQSWVASAAVQATLARTTRTDYSYDVRGQLATQTQWDTVNSSGTGVLDAGTVITTTTYDAQGHLLQTSAETGANRTASQTTTYAYDGMGRLISKTDPLGNVTSYVHIDNGINDTLAITQANGLTTTRVRNSSGQLISSIESSSAANLLSGTIASLSTIGIEVSSTSTTSTYAQVSYKSVQIVQANGTAQWVEGYFVTIVTVNTQTRALIYSRLYATPLTVAQMVQMEGAMTPATLLPLLTPSMGDQINLTVSGSSGQQAQIQYGTTTFTNPDGSNDSVTGELVTVQNGATQTIQYATPLTLAQVISLGTSPTWSALQVLLTPNPNDRITLNAVDNSSTGVRATVSSSSYLNASGSLVTGEFITVSQYNSTGRTTATTKYVTPLTSAQIASLGSAPTVAQIEALITTNAADQIALAAYNSIGQSQIIVRNLNGVPNGQNADGTLQTAGSGEYIETLQYNNAGARTGFTIYATPLTAAQLSSLGTAPTVAQIQALITTSAYDYSSVSVYNSQNQLQAFIAPRTYQNGSGTSFGYFVTLTNYNSAGNQTGSTAYAIPLTSAQMASLGSSPTYAQIQALVTPSNSDNVTVMVFNAAGRQLAMIQGTPPTDADANSATSAPMQETAVINTYDSQGRSTSSTTYANTVTSSQVAALGNAPTLAQVEALLSPSPADQTGLMIYGANGIAATVGYQTHYVTNPDGTVSTVTGEFATLSPDGISGHADWTQLYLTPLTPAQMVLLQATPTLTFLQGLLASNNQWRTTTYAYDAGGNPISTIDPNGDTTYTLYNADNEATYSVDAIGNVTGYRRDSDGRVIGTTQYATALTASQLVTLASTPTAATLQSVLTTSSQDRTTISIYNMAGQVVATIDPVGNVTTTAYDGEGHAIAHTAYATALTSAQLTALGSAPIWAALQADLTAGAGDRTTHTVYDADGRAAATIDAAGFVIVTSYDGGSRAVKTIAYATGLTAAQLAALGSTPTLAALQADLTTNASDQTNRTTYDGDGRVVAQVDADGYLTTMGYDETTHTDTTTRYATALTASQLAALTGTESVTALVGLLGSSIANEQSSTTYNADNQVASTTAVDGTTTTYSYNTVGQLLSTTVTPTAGQGTARTSSATYDGFGDTLTSVDGNHATTTYTYNVLGQRITATNALGNIAYTYYDADGRAAYMVQGQPSGSTRNTLGNVTAYQYNAFGQLTSTRTYANPLTLTTGSSSGTTLNPTTATLAQVASAVAALPVSASDANGVTTYAYTLDGQVASRTNGLGYQTATTYDAFGDRIQVQQQLSQPGSALSAANSTISTFAYDARGEQTSETDGVGTAVARSAASTFDAFGRVTSITDGDGHKTVYAYDNLGRQVMTSLTVQGTARIAVTTYDAFDRTITHSDALGNVTTYQYNLAAHTTIVTTADGMTMRTAKDAFGDTVSITDGAGDITAYTYDADGQLLTTKDALGNTTTNVYDADGELTQTTDATGHAVTYTYNASGKVLTRTVDPAGLNLTTSYAYDGEGRELSITDATGSVTTYAYDAAGRVLTQVQDAGTGKLNLTTTYTYDGTGKTLTVTVGAGTSAARTTQYVYDNLERLSQQIVDPAGLHLTTSYLYDGNNNLTSVTDANGHITRNVYDEANELTFKVTADGGVTQYWYDADGRKTQSRGYATALTGTQLASLGNTPTAAQVAAMVTSTTVDSFEQKAYNAEGLVVYELDGVGMHLTQWTYDAAGRVIAQTRYANLLAGAPAGTSPTVAAIAALVVPSTQDETTLTTYDADGRARFSVQTDMVNGQLVGVVSEQRYDAAGRIADSIIYGTTIPLSSSQPLTSQVSTSSLIQALASAPNHITQNVYDNAGRLRYTIDTTNHVTETQYDVDGRVLATLAYANAITLPGTLTVATLASAVTASGTAGGGGGKNN